VKTVWVFVFLGKNISVNFKKYIDKNRITWPSEKCNVSF